MEETVTFIENEGKVQFTVKKTFLDVVDVTDTNIKHSAYKLLKDHKMGDYLHNQKGPAVRVIVPVKDKKGNPIDYKEYWVDGKRLTQEEGEKMEHNANFIDRAEKLIFDDANE